jgi:hypothetical protein
MWKRHKRIIAGIATSLLYIVLDRMGTSIAFTITLALVSAGLYSWVIWEWSGQFRYNPESNSRNRRGRRQERILRIALPSLFFVLFIALIAYQQIGLQPPLSNEVLNTLADIAVPLESKQALELLR